MALIKCPECGKEISNEAMTCVHCGFPLDKHIGKQKTEIIPQQILVKDAPSVSPKINDRITPKRKPSKKNMAFIAIGVVVIVVVSVWLFQNSTARSAIEAFDNGDYISAKEYADQVFVGDLLKPYEDKIDAMYRIAYVHKRWQQYSGYDDASYLAGSIGLALNVLEECISNSYIAEQNGCENQVYQYAKEVGKWLRKCNVDIEKELIARFEEKGISGYYPLFTELKEEEDILAVIKTFSQFAESYNIFCEECGKISHNHISNPFSGEIETYCQTHYEEIIDIIEAMKSDIYNSK